MLRRSRHLLDGSTADDDDVVDDDGGTDGCGVRWCW